MLCTRYQSCETKLNKWKSVYAYMEVPRRISISSGSSSKRARAPPAGTDDNNYTTTMTQSRGSPEAAAAAAAAQGANNLYYCLVDGCSADLSMCRDYHRRHKVCEIHSKTPKVTISGREQRFCQQCSRFHSLVEFDEGKRSCRNRLDGHNKRRRKPPPLPRKSSGLVSLGRASPQMLQVPNNDQNMQRILNNCSNMICSEASSSFSADQYKGLLMLQNSQVPPSPLLGHIQKNMFDDSDHDAFSLLSSPSPHLLNMHHPQHNPHPLSDHPAQTNYYSSSCCGGRGGPYSYPPLTQQHCINDASTPHLFQHSHPHAGSPTTTTPTASNGSHQTHTFIWE